MLYHAMGTPLVVIAGQEYGTGASRDWAAKGTNLLGVKAVIAESFERIHRSNLVGMGVLPLQFKLDQNRKSLNLTGKETLDILGLSDVELTPRMNLPLVITREDGRQERVDVLCRIDTLNEVEYFKRSEEHTSALQSLMRISYAAFCLYKTNNTYTILLGHRNINKQ